MILQCRGIRGGELLVPAKHCFKIDAELFVARSQ